MKKLICYISLLCTISGVAQTELPEFNMMDTVLTVCDGILYDSGGDGDIYTSNEDFTFTIITDGTITLTFLEEFCIETDFDNLYIYDGPDTGSPLIATLTGTDIGIPPPITSTGGSITIQFTSDSNTNYCGWMLQWDTVVPEPTPPDIEVVTLPICETNIVQVDFSYPIGCNWVGAEDFLFYGDEAFAVESINVICADDSSTVTELVLDQTIDFNCTYTVELLLGIPDVCDSIWNFELLTTFVYDQCLIRSEIIAEDDTICAGNCVNIEALVEGCFEHTFIWDQGLPIGPGPHLVCPAETTTYSVDITEVPTGNTATESITIAVIPATILQNDTTLCQSASLLDLESDPPIGEWYGTGIQDIDLGLFEPDSADAGSNWIYFVASAQCVDSIEITIIPIDAGMVDAACPGSDPFLMIGEPAGGVWSGPFVDPDGTFDPSTSGSHLIYYDVNGCQDSVVVNVDDIAGEFDVGEVCQSIWLDTLDFSPLGGTFSGPIWDSLLGIFVPEDLDPGPNQFLYEVNGCDQLFTVDILEIDIGGRNRNSCPDQEPYQLEDDFAPTGGFWEGLGIIDTELGVFDPGLVPNDFWTPLIYYAPNGCSDTIWMYSRQTEIITDTVFFCDGDDILPLEWETIGRTPWGGSWTGNGILNPWDDNYYEFDPAVAGVGEHWLTYFNNDCQDSVLAIVYPNQLSIESISICQSEPSFILDAGIPSGGTWVGNGIIDAQTGAFDPGVASPGDFHVYWSTIVGCLDSVAITIEEHFESSVSGLESIYCFQDLEIPVTIEPPGGVVSGPVSDDGFFNPATAGEGTFTISVSYEGNLCSSSDSITVSVYPSIETDFLAQDEIICPGSGTTLTVTSGGGFPDVLLQYEWSHNLLALAQNNVSPEESTWYYVTTIDGCSDPVTDSVFIEVLPPIDNTVTTSDTLCFGQPGWAFAQVNQPGNYEIGWGSNPPQFTDSINSSAGSSYLLQITDSEQGCTFDSLILIPNYSPIAALFSINPNSECVAFEDNPLEFIDLSQHGLTGTWDFGNGNIEPYNPGSNPSMGYDVPGDYEASLIIFNEGNCPDSSFLEICILPPTPIFIPDIFSPNNDGNNDILYVRGEGIVEMYFMLYDRWGERVFESTNPEHGWDGFFRGKEMPSGVYVYYLSVVLNNGARSEFKGDITLVR